MINTVHSRSINAVSFGSNVNSSQSAADQKERSTVISSSAQKNQGYTELSTETLFNIANYFFYDAKGLSKFSKINREHFSIAKSLKNSQWEVALFLHSPLAESIIKPFILDEYKKDIANGGSVENISEMKSILKRYNPLLENIIRKYLSKEMRRGILIKAIELASSKNNSNPYITRRHLIDLGLYKPDPASDEDLDKSIGREHSFYIINDLDELLTQTREPNIDAFFSIPANMLSIRKTSLGEFSQDGILEAYRNSHHDIVERMIESRMFLKIHSNRDSLLSEAISKNDMEFIPSLLDEGFPINYHALKTAVKGGSTQMVKLLLDYPKQENWHQGEFTAMDFINILYFANTKENNNLEIVDLIKNCFQNILKYSLPIDFMALCKAVGNNDLDLLKLLIEESNFKSWRDGILSLEDFEALKNFASIHEKELALSYLNSKNEFILSKFQNN